MLLKHQDEKILKGEQSFIFTALTFYSHLQDQRIMQTVAVLLGIDAEEPEGKYYYSVRCFH